MSSYAMRITPRFVSDNIKVFGLTDFFVILMCFSIAALGVYFFYTSLFQTLTSNFDPIGSVTIKYNSIQRRQGDRVLWDRLQNESQLYPGDLIRVAELSGVTLNFNDNYVELNENTLIRINIRNGEPLIELSSGTLNLDTTNSNANISLVVSGRTIEPAAGTILSTSAIIDDEGNTTLTLQVTEGSAVITEDERIHEVYEGTQVTLSADGTEQIIVTEQTINTNEQIADNYFLLEPLPSPQLIQPVNGFTIRPAEIEAMNYRIVFRWSQVNNADAYIFTLYQQTAGEQRQVVQTNLQAITSYVFTNMRLLDRGTFIWQVEAVNTNDGEITRRGHTQQSTFVIDIPAPSAVTPQEPGRLYGQ
jgi:hypothetical protein